VKNGEAVALFERAFADYVGARYAIALCNGTATLHTALVSLGVKPGDRVAVPPLTMSATTIAVLHAGAVPEFWDVDPHRWTMEPPGRRVGGMDGPPKDGVPGFRADAPQWVMPVALYGLPVPYLGSGVVVDAAQTLAMHGNVAFTSYSFQASKILPLGEGGMLVTNDEELATRAREFSSLGYRMRADQPRIDPATLKSPTYERHHTLGWNYRMADTVAWQGYSLIQSGEIDRLRRVRLECAALYKDAVQGCGWLTPQHVPDGWGHDYWAYTVAVRTRTERGDGDPHWYLLAKSIERHGGERPYAAWRLTYHEPAFRHLRTPDVFAADPWAHCACPVAEDLQPRLMQFQTNNLASAEKNAGALRKAIRELGG
jgi:perosamine synthetase